MKAFHRSLPLFLLLFLFPFHRLLAQLEKSVIIPINFDYVVDLSDYLLETESSTDDLTLLQNANWYLFDAESQAQPSMGVKWLKIAIEHKGLQPTPVILYLDKLQDVKVFPTNVDHPLPEALMAGTLIPFEVRQINRGIILEGIGNSAQVKFNLPPGPSSIYLRTNTLYKEVFRPNIQLWPEEKWLKEIGSKREIYIFLQALIFGALIIISLYHFLIFLQNLDMAFLLYALYTSITALILAMDMGILPLITFSEAPINNRVIKESLVLTLTVTILYFLFMQKFINLKELLPRLNRFLNRFLPSFALLGYLLVVVYMYTQNETVLRIGFIFPATALVVGVVFIVAIVRVRNTLANYFIIGSIFLVGGVILNTSIFYLESQGIISKPMIPRTYLTELGVIGEILVFSLGLGYRSRLKEMQSKYLEELDQLKSKFFANISHEFRTPLTVIQGNADLIKGNNKVRSIIKRNSSNLLRLVNQLLDLSKLESGTLKLNYIQADCIQYLRYLTESFYSMAQDKSVSLTFYNEEDELIMDFDEEKLQHIVYNLLSNAIKFTEAGGKVIFHTKKIQRNKTVQLQIKVKDTGVGIPPNEIKHIFDRFYQTGHHQQSTQPGTGIGLSLTKELVEMMGGKITAKSKLGTGTEFTILIPVTNQGPLTEVPLVTLEETPTAEKTISKLKPSNKSRYTLLLIEDNPDVMDYIEDLLKTDYDILKAINGQEGIDKAIASVPDIIISDVMMPLKDGYEVCSTLKNNEKTSHIPIVLLTAKATTEDRIDGLKEGADAYLTKPFNKQELLVRLEKLVSLRKHLQDRYSGIKYTALSKGKAKSKEEEFLQKLFKVIEQHLSDPNLSVNHLCRAANLSNMQVNRKLKALTGKTPSKFIRSIRLEKGMELLQSSDLNVSEIAYDVGFSDPNYFSRAFSEEFGYPPSEVRK